MILQIPELDFEIPPEAQRGSLSTVLLIHISICFVVSHSGNDGFACSNFFLGRAVVTRLFLVSENLNSQDCISILRWLKLLLMCIII